MLEGLRLESVVTIDGEVKARSEATVNPNLPTGEIEVFARKRHRAEQAPKNCRCRSQASRNIRRKFASNTASSTCAAKRCTPISSSAPQIIRETRKPDGRYRLYRIFDADPDRFLPRRRARFLGAQPHSPGKFFALPQAPQQYKQLLMVAGFDRYFQIAPCFRDEDPRADRLPGEFYQLDLEMSFVTQEEVWETMEPVMAGIFETFANGRKVTPAGEFPRIPYAKAMLDYGTDKPDLRNPLIIRDVTEHFRSRALDCSKRLSAPAALYA
jgi:aspartyl-tRNA synthetase